MKKVVWALVFCCSPVFAITNNPDGSVTLTKQEIENMTETLQTLAADSYQYEIDRERAKKILFDLQKEQEALQKGKCI